LEHDETKTFQQCELCTYSQRCLMKMCTADAERVAKRRDLMLNDAKLSIRQLLPGRPPTFVTAANDAAYLSDTFLFVDLLQRVDTDKLQQYAEQAADIAVDKIIFSCTKPSTALVKYSADAGTDAVLSFSCVH